MPPALWSSGAMDVCETTLPDVLLLSNAVHADDRGFFLETFRRQEFDSTPLRDKEFVQENHSRSQRGVLRGMHFQIGDGLGKLVRCGRGEIFDVAVDLRRGSPTYGRWEGFKLDDIEHRQLWIPVGFAHGFLTISDEADVIYRQTGYYEPALDRSVAWNDSDIAVGWPLDGEPTVSARDAAAPLLRDIADELPFVYAQG
jgi:dTDP-4-dehydrorhamnose 3,5-epimerase